MSNSVKYYKRDFLNKGEGMAVFEAYVDWVESPEYNTGIDAGFSITDCNRKISLDFYVHNDESFENAEYKLNTLIDQLNIFKGHIQEARKKQAKKADELKEAKESDEPT